MFNNQKLRVMTGLSTAIVVIALFGVQQMTRGGATQDERLIKTVPQYQLDAAELTLTRLTDEELATVKTTEEQARTGAEEWAAGLTPPAEVGELVLAHVQQGGRDKLSWIAVIQTVGPPPSASSGPARNPEDVGKPATPTPVAKDWMMLYFFDAVYGGGDNVVSMTFYEE